MSPQITQDDLKDNTFFWLTYIGWFRGYDAVDELPINEVLEIIPIDNENISEWENSFFRQNEDFIRFVEIHLHDKISFSIEFHDDEIVFFLNDIYIGNLGGHFEAWFLTWNELLAFQFVEHLFLLLLPMTAVEKQQENEAKILITKYLKEIPKFENDAEYIAQCILNGIVIDEPFFEQNEIGTVNNQHHSVRNIKKYPIYKENTTKANEILRLFVAGKL